MTYKIPYIIKILPNVNHQSFIILFLFVLKIPLYLLTSLNKLASPKPMPMAFTKLITYVESLWNFSHPVPLGTTFFC